jgi:1-acyl-sn-glycerol-3-phosphate acyltransferase
MVIAVAPHTHWMDFILAVLVRHFLKEPIHFLGKKELFNPLTNKLFRALGGMPVDRSAKNNTVAQAVAYFEQKKVFRLTISPEGTRKKVKEFKSGFYHIAHNAQVPIFPVAFDFENKKMIFHSLFYTTGNKEKDILQIEVIFEGVKGRIPKNSFFKD